MKEKEIIELIIQRDERGIKELQIHYGPLIRYIIAPILKNTHDQEECFSEVTVKIWDKIHQYDADRGSWAVWVTSISRNTALNRLRQTESTVSIEEIPIEIASSAPTPEEALIQKEQENILKKALNQLSAKDRSLFYRKYYYLQSTAQIAAELSMTERAVEGKLYRIRKRLKALLGGDGFEQ